MAEIDGCHDHQGDDWQETDKEDLVADRFAKNAVGSHSVARDLAKGRVAGGSICVTRISGYPSEIISKQEMAMQFSQVQSGRIFALRLHDGEIVYEVIERFALEQHIETASLIILGGADDGSTWAGDPAKDRELPL